MDLSITLKETPTEQGVVVTVGIGPRATQASGLGSEVRVSGMLLRAPEPVGSGHLLSVKTADARSEDVVVPPSLAGSFGRSITAGSRVTIMGHQPDQDRSAAPVEQLSVEASWRRDELPVDDRPAECTLMRWRVLDGRRRGTIGELVATPRQRRGGWIVLDTGEQRSQLVSDQTTLRHVLGDRLRRHRGGPPTFDPQAIAALFARLPGGLS